MERLRYSVHPDAIDGGSEKQRPSVRAVVHRDDKVLLLYTQRYDDYSLPGGGVDEGEELETALVRELAEETGARGIRVNQALGQYEELRPWYKDDADNLRIQSYCYLCDIEGELGQARLEDYEQANGMRPVWIRLGDAIDHNRTVMAQSPKAGLSIERETWLMEWLQQRKQ